LVVFVSASLRLRRHRDRCRRLGE